MPGTVQGGKNAAKTNKEKYGDDFYRKIGAKGGKLGHNGGWGQGAIGRERARVAGAKGGRISRREKKSWQLKDGSY